MAAAPPPNQTNIPHLLSTYRSLLDTFTSFLTVATHHILFLRKIYPPVSFLSARAYNYPVRQNRHPAVCAWINDAVSAIRDQLEKNTVEKVSLCIYECDQHRVLEKWTFDLYSFPIVSRRDRDVPFSDPDDRPLANKINLVDLEASFRATLSRIGTAAAKLKPLPDGPTAPECSFTMTIEVKETADRPVGRLEAEERKWIAAESESFTSTEVLSRSMGSDISHGTTRIDSPLDRKNLKSNQHDDLDYPAKEAEKDNEPKGKTHPVRRLETGAFRVEVWVEESEAKLSLPSSLYTASILSSKRTPAERAAAMSYGAGTEKFDPENGYYDLEPPDVNRKPQGGAMTDYQRQ